MRKAFRESRQMVGLYPVTTEDIWGHTFPQLRREGDDPLRIAHHPDYEEGRCSTALHLLNKHLDFTYDNISIIKATFSTNINTKVLWITMSEHEVRKVIMRGAQKRPTDLSIRSHCPALGFERKLAASAALKAYKESHPNNNYQIRLGIKDYEMWEKIPNKPWNKGNLAELGPLPPPLPKCLDP